MKCTARYDDIPSYTFKGVSILIAPFLAWLYNLSLRSGMFLKCWKISLVSPTPKINLQVINNYIPVSALCFVMKVFDKIIHELLCMSLSLYIDAKQHGSMLNRSTATNRNEMMSFTDDDEVENRGQVDIVYFKFVRPSTWCCMTFCIWIQH
ncbi:uncharacterized protein LOC142321263 [Lycorma delicatula]|uniref:uncharacterized protein LOC142321263 n=1 Tax=Lycorma delicatula TaxID=130591 RepID=UPI003F516A4D